MPYRHTPNRHTDIHRYKNTDIQTYKHANIQPYTQHTYKKAAEAKVPEATVPEAKVADTTVPGLERTSISSYVIYYTLCSHAPEKILPAAS